MFKAKSMLPKVGGLKSIMPSNRILSMARRNPVKIEKPRLKIKTNKY